MMRIGILTGGGDGPGLNAVIRGLVLTGVKQYGYEFIGFRDGWAGPVKNLTLPLSRDAVRGGHAAGGTMLGTSRTNPLKEAGAIDKIRANLEVNGVDVLVAIGGDDTLGVAAKLAAAGIQTIGVPKTIDNDLSATDYTFGFDTAVANATAAIDALRTTADSHHRVFVVEVMGRHAGWIALHSGIAGGADYTMLPERETDLLQLCAAIQREYGDGRKNYALVVVSEGARLANMEEFALQDESRDAFGNVRLGGIGKLVARLIERETGRETRVVVLGHTQRGGSPTAHDRVLSTRYGNFAARMIHDGAFGQMAALQGDAIVAVPLAAATLETKVVGQDWIELLEVLQA